MLLLRPAQSADAAEVAGVHVRSWQAAYRGLLPNEDLDGLDPADRAAVYTFGLTDPAAPQTIVAVADGVIVGFATTAPAPDEDLPGYGVLGALYVDPPHWDSGAGRALIAAARDALVERGFHDALLWVLFGNERAERFYRIDGWTPDGARKTDEVWGISVDEIRYRRKLP